MPGLGLAIDAFRTRPFSICITTLTDSGDGGFRSVLSVVFFLDTDGTRIGFATGSTGAGATVICVGCGAAATTGGASALLNPVIANTVDRPTPIRTAAIRNAERC